MDFSVVVLAAGTSPRRGCRLAGARPVRVHRISDGHRVPAPRSVHDQPLSVPSKGGGATTSSHGDEDGAPPVASTKTLDVEGSNAGFSKPNGGSIPGSGC